MVQPGYGAYRLRGRLYHIRAVVDDYYVVRVWSKRLQEWVYSIVPQVHITDLLVIGTAQKVNARQARGVDA